MSREGGGLDDHVIVGSASDQEELFTGSYRLLHDLYGRMQVTNRSQAIANAARLGVLD